MWDVGTHQASKDAAMIWHQEVKEFVDKNELLKVQIFVEEIGAECDRSTRRTGSPLRAHHLHLDASGCDANSGGPMACASLQLGR